MESALQFLRCFGHLITDIVLPSAYASVDQEEVARYVGKYASSVTAMHIKFNAAWYLQKANDANYDKHEASVSNALKSLTEIRTLYAMIFSYKVFFNFAQLPHLESLTVEYAEAIFKNKPKLHFKNVRHFCLKQVMFVDHRIAERLDYPLTFERLESLMIRTHGPNEIPINLFLNNTEIKSLAWTGSFNLADFFDILDQMNATHRIENIKIAWQNGMNQENSRKLVTDYDSLQRIIFCVAERNGMESFLRFISSVQNTWDIIDSWTGVDDFHVYPPKMFFIVIQRKSIESDENIEPYELTFDRRVPKEMYMPECKKR